MKKLLFETEEDRQNFLRSLHADCISSLPVALDKYKMRFPSSTESEIAIHVALENIEKTHSIIAGEKE